MAGPCPECTRARRGVRSGMASSDRFVVHDVVIPAGLAEVWRAFTDPTATETWMGGFRLESTWVPGEPCVIRGRLNGKRYAEGGVVLACEPGALLRFDHWSRLWRIPDGPGNRAVMTVVLSPEGEGTRVVMTHALPEVAAIGPHARFFWSVALDLLRRTFEPAGPGAAPGVGARRAPQ